MKLVSKPSEWLKGFKENFGFGDEVKKDIETFNKAKEAAKAYWKTMRDNGGNVNAAVAATKSLKGLNEQTKAIIISSKSETAARKEVAKALGIQTVAQKALNAAAMIGKAIATTAFTAAVSVIISKVYELVNAQKKEQEALRELREEARNKMSEDTF